MTFRMPPIIVASALIRCFTATLLMLPRFMPLARMLDAAYAARARHARYAMRHYYAIAVTCHEMPSL